VTRQETWLTVRHAVGVRVRGVLGMPEPGPHETPREQLLALAELARRVGGDAPRPPADHGLTPFELRVFSQNGEDGVIAEILRRAGIATGSFVEFGAADGVQNNCAVLADVLGWSGLFIEAGDDEFARLSHRYAANDRVRTAQAIVTPETVERLFAEHDVPLEPDVLSIDVDGSDYWIWEALERYRPRIVVIEYNGSLTPGRRLVQPRDTGMWDLTDFQGASIEAMTTLGERKGYRLVHCEMTGNNAFFVRDGVPGDYPAPEAVARRRTNFWLAGSDHPPDPLRRAYLDLDDEERRQG
jgi:hypothetical protein